MCTCEQPWTANSVCLRAWDASLLWSARKWNVLWEKLCQDKKKEKKKLIIFPSQRVKEKHRWYLSLDCMCLVWLLTSFYQRVCHIVDFGGITQRSYEFVKAKRREVGSSNSRNGIESLSSHESGNLNTGQTRTRSLYIQYSNFCWNVGWKVHIQALGCLL